MIIDNKKKPAIKVFYTTGLNKCAKEIGYGIEEEGLPYQLVSNEKAEEKALEETLKIGIGVAISLTEEEVAIYYRGFKSKKAFISYTKTYGEKLRMAGKNSGKIIKQKPIICEVIK